MTNALSLRAAAWTISAAVWSALIFGAFSMGMKMPDIQISPKPNDPIEVVTESTPPKPLVRPREQLVRTVPREDAPVEIVTIPTIADPAPLAAPFDGTMPGQALAPSPHITNPQWLSRPGAREFERFYPARARERAKEGRVTLDCLVRANGAIGCTVADETPAGWGFGEAALKIAPSFRLAPRLEDGRPTEGGSVRVNISFRLDS
jgi:periplasmic protein TonB